MKKRILAVTLGLVMVGGIFTGCGTKKEDTNEATKDKGSVVSIEDLQSATSNAFKDMKSAKISLDMSSSSSELPDTSMIFDISEKAVHVSMTSEEDTVDMYADISDKNKIIRYEPAEDDEWYKRESSLEDFESIGIPTSFDWGSIELPKDIDVTSEGDTYVAKTTLKSSDIMNFLSQASGETKEDVTDETEEEDSTAEEDTTAESEEDTTEEAEEATKETVEEDSEEATKETVEEESEDYNMMDAIEGVFNGITADVEFTFNKDKVLESITLKIKVDDSVATDSEVASDITVKISISDINNCEVTIPEDVIKKAEAYKEEDWGFSIDGSDVEIEESEDDVNGSQFDIGDDNGTGFKIDSAE